MGYQYKTECSNCGHVFEVSEGGGFVFHLLRCNQCGGSKSTSFIEIGEPHLRYIKGLGMPYSSATAEFDAKIQQNCQGKPLSQRAYHRIVEKMAGDCGCGGKLKFKATPRCPKCKSTKLIGEEIIVLYD